MKSDDQFFVVGAQKCATSWLYYCLREHPDLHLPGSKRENVYLGGDLHQRYGTDWYFRHIGEPNGGQRVGDVSVDYLFDPRSPEAIHRAVPDAKIIASLRNPIERAISAYYWNLRRGNVRKMDLGAGMQHALESRQEAERPDLPYNPNNYRTNILARGLYDLHIRRYREYFSPNQFLLLPYCRIKKQGLEILGRVYKFIGVDPSFRPSKVSQSRRPKQNSYRSFLLRVERDTPNNPFWGRAANLAHQLICSLGLHRERPSLPEGVEEELHEFYRGHMHKLMAQIQEMPVCADLWSEISWSEGSE